jgi:hypothetical protein
VGGLRSARAAAGRTIARPALWPIGLAGFLARGGIVLFSLPIIVAPSVVGVGTFIGPASITPDGPTTGLVVRIALWSCLAIAALVAGTIIGAAAEIELTRTGEAAPAAKPRLAKPGLAEPGVAESGGRSSRLLGRVFLIRLVGLAPLALVLAVGLQRLGQIAYLELTLPTNLTSPIVVRVAGQAPEVVGAIVLAWLAGELVAGLAVRLAVRDGSTVARSIGGALGLLARRPLDVLLVSLGSLLVVIPVLGLAIGLVDGTWQLARAALLGGGGPAGVGQMIGSTLLLVLAWTVALTLAGALATWRSLGLTLTVGEDHRGSGRMRQERATL